MAYTIRYGMDKLRIGCDRLSVGVESTTADVARIIWNDSGQTQYSNTCALNPKITTSYSRNL